MRTYAKMGDYEIRDICNLNKEPDENPTEFDVVLYYNHSPIECTDYRSGKKIITVRSCYSIGQLRWDEKEDTWDFESVGLRYLEDGNSLVNNWILDFCEKKAREFLGAYDE